MFQRSGSVCRARVVTEGRASTGSENINASARSDSTEQTVNMVRLIVYKLSMRYV